MIDLAWTIEDDRDAELTDAPRPLLSTWHYLRHSLRRGWRTWVGLAVLGAVLGLAAVVLVPPGSTATVTLLMAHPPDIEGPEGRDMDVSLLSTREVADRTVKALGLDLTPEAFRATVSVEPITTEILTLAVSGPDDASAMVRAQELVTQYLAYRSTTLSSRQAGFIAGQKSRIASMQQQVQVLTKQYDQLSELGADGQGPAFEVLQRRADLNTQITSAQKAIEDATLQTSAAIDSTHVIDPVHAVQSSTKKAMVLAVSSGLLAGAALGVGIVLFRALVSERLRRRREVGIALSSPVRFSVRSGGPRDDVGGRIGRLLPDRRRWHGSDLDTLAHGLESALIPHLGVHAATASRHATAGTAVAPNGRASASTPESTGTSTAKVTAGLSASGKQVIALATASARASGPSAAGLTSSGGPAVSDAESTDTPQKATSRSRSARKTGRGTLSANGAATTKHEDAEGAGGPGSGVALAAIGNTRAAADVIGATATSLRGRGVSVFVVDLSRSGTLAARAAQAGEGEAASEILRPSGIPGLAHGPRGAALQAGVDLPGEAWKAAWETADVVLALVEVDPGIDVEHLASWVEQVVPLVTAGGSTAELLETTAELIRAAELTLPFAMMVGCDRSDQSLGLVSPSEVGAGQASQG